WVFLCSLSHSAQLRARLDRCTRLRGINCCCSYIRGHTGQLLYRNRWAGRIGLRHRFFPAQVIHQERQNSRLSSQPAGREHRETGACFLTGRENATRPSKSESRPKAECCSFRPTSEGECREIQVEAAAI